jgi:TM2 domain-containing membrane protein YozV/Tfp pilus assembly protein PilE
MSQSDQIIQSKEIDEKFCSECGRVIKIKAEICPKCGVRQKNIEGVNKIALLLLTFFLGGFGAHKFYLGKNWQGFFYLLFCWTSIPSIIALIEFVIYVFTSSDTLQGKYTVNGKVGVIIAIVVGGFGMIGMIGILAAIAIPQFVAYKNRAYQVATESELQILSTAEKNYFEEHKQYSNDLQLINFTQTNPEITVEIISADKNCYEAVGVHTQLPRSVTIDCNSY